MFRKITVTVTLVAFLLSIAGCYRKHQISFEEVKEKPWTEITALTTMDGTLIEFADPPDIDVEHQIITGIAKGYRHGRVRRDSEAVVLKFEEVQMLYVKKIDPILTTVAVIGISAVVGLTALLVYAATKESCPFVYSFDGERYVFDGEPYGGAISEGLKRSDLCRLEHLVPVDNQYRLLLTNEVNETQYTDEFKLWVVDHSPSVDVVQDAAGNLYTVDSLMPPLAVTDSHGKDWTNWLSQKDMTFWESDVLAQESNENPRLRDTLVLKFAKPAGVSEGKLVVHGGTTLWGSQMLRQIAELAGNQVELWYASHKLPAQREQRAQWNDREEVYQLGIGVRVGDEWLRRGELLGGGPFMVEERVVPLDLADVDGDTVFVRIMPPTGFWKLNSFRMDYSIDSAFQMEELSLVRATGDDGSDIRELLDATDGEYYAMPTTGQSAELVFSVPPQPEGTERTLFAKASGYYSMHLDATGPPDLATAARVRTEPGFITKFALEEYFKWRAEHLADVPDTE